MCVFIHTNKLLILINDGSILIHFTIKLYGTQQSNSNTKKLFFFQVPTNKKQSFQDDQTHICKEEEKHTKLHPVLQ